jgi:probable HAF family extracellular repeat protein
MLEAGRESMRAFLLGLALVVTASLARATPMFMGLGTLPGDDRSFAQGVSADGSVAVGFGSSQAFRWTVSTGMVQLAPLPGSSSTRASAVSGDGSVVVGFRRYPSGPNTERNEALRWTPSGDVSSLGFTGSATGVSADGSVIVGQLVDVTSEAFRWTSEAGAVGLGVLPGGNYSFAFDVSADGSTIAGSSETPESTEAFRWTSDTGMVSLVTLPGLLESEARALSPDGSVVVGLAVDESEVQQAFRWTSDGGMVLLGLLPGVIDGATAAYAVSADGSVIVGDSFDNSEGVGIAFIWDPVQGMRSLRDVLIGEYGLDLTGWTLTTANGISADARTIVGTGLNPSGQNEAWIAVLPEPSTALFLAIGLAGLAVWRRRSV